MSANIMIDIESLGLAPNSVILSIGAVTDSGEEFYQEIKVSDQGDRIVDLDTVKWWMTQPIKPPMEGTFNLTYSLYELQKFILAFKECNVWANGTDFDITVLTDAYRQLNLPTPWAYNAVRDYRTLSKLFPQVIRPPFVGEKHNALADAKNQMAHLKLILSYIMKLESLYEPEKSQPAG